MVPPSAALSPRCSMIATDVRGTSQIITSSYSKIICMSLLLTLSSGPWPVGATQAAYGQAGHSDALTSRRLPQIAGGNETSKMARAISLETCFCSSSTLLHFSLKHHYDMATDVGSRFSNIPLHTERRSSWLKAPLGVTRRREYKT